VKDNGGTAVALVGTTASGKSALAHRFSREHPGVEIVAVDAMTVYCGMDIGTAKPSARERSEVSYHLLDLVEPSEDFTLFEYQRCARDATREIWRRGGAAFYVGGTGLHARAILDDLDIPRQYPQVRADVEERARVNLAATYEQLVRLDPLAASRMEPTNERRIVRALEVTMGSGRPFSSYGPGLGHYGESRVRQVGLRVEVEEIDRRIERRFRSWMDEGLLNEVASLVADDRTLSRSARQAVGYRELLRHVEQGEDLEICVNDAITQSRRLARRQRSWFLRDPRIEWFDDPDEAATRIGNILNGPDGFVRD
jgi:tRNA dimethylallyltransferase